MRALTRACRLARAFSWTKAHDEISSLSAEAMLGWLTPLPARPATVGACMLSTPLVHTSDPIPEEPSSRTLTSHTGSSQVCVCVLSVCHVL